MELTTPKTDQTINHDVKLASARRSAGVSGLSRRDRLDPVILSLGSASAYKSSHIRTRSSFWR